MVSVSRRLLFIILRRRVASSLCNGLGILLVLVDIPVKDIVVLEGLSDKEIAEDLVEVGIVRLVIEIERPGVVERSQTR